MHQVGHNQASKKRHKTWLRYQERALVKATLLAVCAYLLASDLLELTWDEKDALDGRIDDRFASLWLPSNEDTHCKRPPFVQSVLSERQLKMVHKQQCLNGSKYNNNNKHKQRDNQRRFLVTLVKAIRVIRLEAPKSVQAGQQIKLRCLIEATRGDLLQSLAWYKNGREFYRYQPFERRRPVLTFNTTGVHVDLTRSKNTTVFLINTSEKTSGRYRCEATGTSFQEASMDANVEVLQAAPSSGIASSLNSINRSNSEFVLTISACVSMIHLVSTHYLYHFCRRKIVIN